MRSRRSRAVGARGISLEIPRMERSRGTGQTGRACWLHGRQMPAGLPPPPPPPLPRIIPNAGETQTDG